MKKLLVLSGVAIVILLLFLASCGSNKNSTEACIHETSLNLDKGNYDAVLASTCADAMQKGAAWFGKAGYDIKSVLNNFVDANSSSTQNKSDLNIYMTSLTGNVTSNTLISLETASTWYGSVLSGDPGYKDAQFYLSLVYAIKSLDLIKTVIPASVNSDGTLNTSCDENNNKVPDDADATACALLTSAGQACTANTSLFLDTGTVTTLTLSSAGTGTLSGQYRGLITQVTGTGSSSTCPASNQYKRLLFKSGALWITATPASDTCTEVSPVAGRTWPCPIETNAGPLDLVTAINDSIDGSISALNSALTGSSSDVQQSIQDIKAQACCGCVTAPCPPCGTACTSTDIANYLQTNLK